MEKLARQGKAQMKLNFPQIETAIEIRLGRILETLNQRRSHFSGIEAEDESSQNSSTQFLQMEKTQLIDLQEKSERYCITLLVFQFNSARYDIKLKKSYLLPILVKERDIQPIVIKKVNQFVLFNSSNIQLLDILNFPGALAILVQAWKLTGHQRRKDFFHTIGSTTQIN